jgi:hypothetical protein
MKKNMLRTMVNLRIDEDIRGLVRQLWKHNYETIFSCSGHNIPEKSEIIYMEKTGDGWFEKNAEKYGLKETEEKDCCEKVRKIDEEFVEKYGKQKTNLCWDCGHWFNGRKKYYGTLIPDPFKP